MRLRGITDYNLVERYTLLAFIAGEAALGEPVCLHTRIHKFFCVRCLMAEYLRRNGFQIKQIGSILNKHHSEVLYMLNKVEIMKDWSEFRELRRIFIKTIKKYESENKKDSSGCGDTIQDL